MHINLSNLRHMPNATQVFHSHQLCPPFSVGPDLLTLEDALDVNLKIMRVGKSFIISGSLQAHIKVCCARCLKEFAFPLDVDFEDEWVLAEDFREYSDVFQQRQDDVFCLAGEDVDITERIMEHLIVSLPMRFICSSECRGLCPQCGHNLNTGPCTCQDQAEDSRLKILAQWNNKK